jgi:glycosyltransferase involved in cell wall biosynthesis
MVQKLPISVIVLTHNEEQNIKDCLLSIRDWADEIFVVDSGSSDQTLTITADFTDKIFQHPFENYSKQRNWSQDNLPIRNEWIFHIDADERVTPGLVEKMKTFFENVKKNDDTAGLLVRSRIEFLGRHIKHGGLYPTYHCRIYKKQAGRCENRAYDQHFIVDGKVNIIPEDLIEVTATSLESWTARHNRWAQLEAQYLHTGEKGDQNSDLDPGLFGSPIQRRRWLRVSILEQAPLFFRSLIYFLYRFFLRGGFLDGKEGLIYHVLHGFWFRFYVDSCIFELKNQSKVERI